MASISFETKENPTKKRPDEFGFMTTRNLLFSCDYATSAKTRTKISCGMLMEMLQFCLTIFFSL